MIANRAEGTNNGVLGSVKRGYCATDFLHVSVDLLDKD